MNLYFKIALIWFGGYLLAVFAILIVTIAIYIKTLNHKPRLLQYSDEDERLDKMLKSLDDNYMLKPTFINRIIDVLVWPVTVGLVVVWVRKEFIPFLKTCPEGEVEKEPEMQITATWDFEDDDKEA